MSTAAVAGGAGGAGVKSVPHVPRSPPSVEDEGCLGLESALSGDDAHTDAACPQTAGHSVEFVNAGYLPASELDQLLSIPLSHPGSAT